MNWEGPGRDFLKVHTGVHTLEVYEDRLDPAISSGIRTAAVFGGARPSAAPAADPGPIVWIRSAVWSAP